MNKRSNTLITLLCAGALLGTLPNALAEEHEAFEPAHINLRDQAALQHGAKLFVNYCLSCHTAQYMRYKRMAQDLGLSEDQVEKNLIFTDQRIGDTMTVAMRPQDASRWFGKAPPDLSVVARRKGPADEGADWLLAFLKGFYADPKSASGWNNTVLQNAAMPNVLSALQGIQKPVFDEHGNIRELELVQTGSLTPEAYDRAVHDLVSYLVYMGEPARLQRSRIGPWVLLYLVIFTLLAYLLKHEYWKDVT